MNAQILVDRQKLYELAEWFVTAMTLLLGYRYLKQIVAYVLMQLYRIFIQKGMIAI